MSDVIKLLREVYTHANEVGKTKILEAVRIIEQEAEQPPRFGEARFVAFTSQRGSLVLPVKKDGAGVVWEITVRGDTLDGILSQMVLVQNKAIEAGFVPMDAYLDQRKSDREAAAPAAPQQTAPVAGSGGTTTGDTFLCESIMAAPMSDSKPDLIWKIKGSKSKYPVAIYEAIDEAKPLLAQEGIDLSSFTTSDGKLRSYQMSGWVAHYVKNDKGYPAKVTKLVKG